MKEKVVLRGGTIFTEEASVEADLYIDEKGTITRIVKRSADGTTPDAGMKVIDCSGLWVLPGAVDTHVHFREPGLEEKEDFLTGSKAAATGGVTTVLDMPNTVPPVQNKGALRQKKQAIQGRSYVDYGLFGVLTPAGHDRDGAVDMLIRQVEELLDEGACGIKVFAGPTTGDIRAPDWGTLYPVCRHFAQRDVVFTFHCEDRDSIVVATKRLGNASTHDDYDVLLASRPRFGELLATDAALRLALETGARIHIAHVALKEAVDAIGRAKQLGARVTAETGPQYLFLSQDDYPRLGDMMKVLPPIRSLDDQKALWDGLRAGIIDCIATDHAPHQRLPGRQAVLEGPFGAAGVETMLPMMVDGAIQGRFTVSDVVRWCAFNPAMAYGLSRKGRLAVGTDADFVLIDPTKPWEVNDDFWRSKSRNSPFWGRKGMGVAVMTFLRGELIAEHNDVIQTPKGSFLPGYEEAFV